MLLSRLVATIKGSVRAVLRGPSWKRHRKTPLERYEIGLRNAIIADQNPRKAQISLISLLTASGRVGEAEDLAREAVGRWPDDPEPWLALARCESLLFRYLEAARTLESVLKRWPENSEAWFDYGELARDSQIPNELPPSKASDAYRAAARHANGAPRILQATAHYFSEINDFGEAVRLYRELFEGSLDNMDPAPIRDYARCLRALGHEAEAMHITDRGVARSRSISASLLGEALEVALREEARLLLDAGRTVEADGTFRRILDAASHHVKYSRPEYLPHTSERLARLREIVAGRDLILFLQGPSFSDFAEQIEALRDTDAVFATLGAFPPVEKVLQEKLDRSADLVFVAHPDLAQTWRAELDAFVARDAKNLVIATQYALSNLSEFGEEAEDFVARHDERFLFVYPVGGPPLPSVPLHFEPGNSLACFLPILILGLPRRIFLIGADGGGHPRMLRPYFFYDDIDAGDRTNDHVLDRPGLLNFQNRPEMLLEVNRRYEIEAAACDRICTTASQFLSHLFNVPTPQIYNVCPHSTHKAYPKIDTDTAIALLRERS